MGGEGGDVETWAVILSFALAVALLGLEAAVVAVGAALIDALGEP